MDLICHEISVMIWSTTMYWKKSTIFLWLWGWVSTLKATGSIDIVPFVTRWGLPLWLLHLTYLIRPSWNIPNINFLLVAVRLLVLELKYNCINPHIVVMSICEHPGHVDKNSWEGNYQLDCETLLLRLCHGIHFSFFNNVEKSLAHWINSQLS